MLLAKVFLALALGFKPFRFGFLVQTFFLALFRFGWNATFPTRFMVRPLLFAKDFQAGE